MKYGLDIETTGLEWYDKLITVQLYSENDHGYFFDCRKDSERAAVSEMLLDPTNVFSIFSSLYDCYYIYKDLEILLKPAGDAYILAMMAQIPDQSLDALSKRFLRKGKIGDLADITGGAMSFDQEITQEMKDYGVRDAELALQLEEKLIWRYKKMTRIYNLELNLVPVLVKMRLRGLKISKEVWHEKVEEYTAKSDKLYNRMADEVGRDFRYNATADVGSILFDEVGVGGMGLQPVILSPKTKVPSCSAEALAYFKHISWVRDLQELKHMKSVLSSARKYDETLEDGWAHPEFRPINYSGAARIYTTKPAVNQLPTELRHAIVPDEGKLFLYIDWSGAELILMAYAAGEEDIINVYESGGDVHRFVTSEITGVPIEDITDERREVSKVVTFSIVYGSEGGAAARALQIPFEEGKRLANAFLDRFRRIRDWREKQGEKALDTGSVYTLMGRRRVLMKIKSRVGSVKKEGVRQAMNTPIQNGVADLQKWALIRLDRNLPEGSRLVFSVFDSFLLEIPDDISDEYRQRIKTCLKKAFHFELGDLTIDMRYKALAGKKSFGQLQDES